MEGASGAGSTGGSSSGGGASSAGQPKGGTNFLEESAVRRAEPDDCATVLRFVHALAHFHSMPDAVQITIEQLEHAMFKSHPRQLWAFLATIRRRDDAKALVAAEEAPAGMVTYHYRYSPALAGRILYIEDLFVSDECRGRGLGVALLRAACEEALRNCCRAIHFKVHRDNAGAKRLYVKHGAMDLSESGQVRLFHFDRDSRYPHTAEKIRSR